MSTDILHTPSSAQAGEVTSRKALHHLDVDGQIRNDLIAQEAAQRDSGEATDADILPASVPQVADESLDGFGVARTQDEDPAV